MAGPQQTAAPGVRTAAEVAQMFRSIGLPVCDDEAAIRAKIAEESPRYQIMKNRSQTDRTLIVKAEAWFKDTTELMTNRSALLEVVYKAFGAATDGDLGLRRLGGVRVLTSAVAQQFVASAIQLFHVDNALASQFVDRYLKERNLEIGGQLLKFSFVENLQAVSGIGRISLSWTRPAQNCEGVLIVRLSPDGREDEFETAGESFEDPGVAPGVSYTYRFHSRNQGESSDQFVEITAVSIGEVTKARAAWKHAEVLLQWNAAGAPSVQIFRREGSAPELRFGPDGPAPDSPATVRVYQGAFERFADTNVAEGVTYFYRIVSDFGQGRCGRGVDVQVTIPQPPAAVRSLHASYKREADKDVVQLEWPPAAGVAGPEYVVVRREGEAPAARQDEGVLVTTTSQTRCLDESVASGHRYTYAVFTQAGGLSSRAGTAAPAVDILTEISGLKANTGDGTVELAWTTPSGASSVIIRRSLQPPRDRTEGTLVPLTGEGNAKDTGLRNGGQYHYLVCCGYRPAGGEEIFSPGMRIAAVPVMLPDAVTRFSAKPHAAEVVCTWDPPACGQAVVLRSVRPHGLPAGRRLNAKELNALGERIVASESGSATDANPVLEKPYYAVFTVAGEHAVVGGTSLCVVAPDVTHLSPQPAPEGVVLRWRWPDGCTLVRVARRLDHEPDGPDDPNAVVFPCMKSDYDAAGGKLLDRLGTGGHYYYAVYAQPAGAPAQFFSSGSDPGCRLSIEWHKTWTTMHYQLSAKPEAAGRSMLLSWRVDEAAPNFAGFSLLADVDDIPNSIDDGIELFRWAPAPGPIAGAHEAEVDLEPVQRRRWARFYAKAFPLNTAQRFTTKIVHPNVCIQISDKGILQVPKLQPIERRYKPGVPSKVICPQCFSEFPTGQILFAGYDGGDPRPGEYTLFDRMRGRPPQPPVDDKGKKLTKKICPKCKKQLPFTAGGQASLIIGLIGAKFVGKSHYVAALVDRLSKQVGSDLQAALIPTSEDTNERYLNEFYNPLFRNRLELPMTPGTPPPLIYDLRFNGSLWGEEGWRSVTLALYDTAGENFDKPEKVREMVEYLRFASGAVLLIDPLQVDAVRQALPDSVRKPDADAMADPHAVLTRVYQELVNGKVVADNAPLGIPVAVVLTKCDVLSELIDGNRLWHSDHRHRGYFDREAHEDMVGMFGEYVRRWSPQVYNNVTQRFARHAFFGASATGCASDSRTRRFNYVSPMRVEDPLLWLLAELGVIPSR